MPSPHPEPTSPGPTPWLVGGLALMLSACGGQPPECTAFCVVVEVQNVTVSPDKPIKGRPR